MIVADFKPLHCRCCHRQLALATPYRLLFNVGVYCEEPVALRCTTCGARRFWKPLDSIAYTEESVSVLCTVGDAAESGVTPPGERPGNIAGHQEMGSGS